MRASSKVLVPQVYAVVKPDDIDGNGNVLSAKTADLKLKGDLVNTGLLAARGNLNVKAENISNVAGTIKGQDISLYAKGNLQSIQGAIDAANNLKLRSGGDTTIVAGSIKAGGNADVNAGGDLTIVANNKGRVVNVAWGETDEERAGNYLIDAQYNETGTQIDIKGKLNMSAGGNLTAQGATINAAAIAAKAGNDIVVTGRRTGYQYESVLNSGDVSRTTKRTDLTNQLSNWNAGNISMNAGHDITLQGVNLNGANVSLAAGHNLSAIEVYDIKETVDINSSVSMFRQRVSIDINSERTAIGNSIGNGSGVVTRTAGNNILDRGTTIAGIAQSSIAGNRISEETIKSTIHQERTRTTGGAFWVSTQSQGSTQETLQMTNIFVPSNASRFQAAGGVSVQLPKGSDLRAQIDRLKGQPGNEYLGQLAERSDIDWQEVEVINKTWNYKKETMGPATAIIVAIAVSVLTGGMASALGTSVSGGLGLTGTVAGKMVAASVTAGVSSLASMTATAVINNGGDLGAALEELGNSDNVKNLLVSMATAGLLEGINENIPVELLNDKGVLAPSFLSKATLQNATFAQLLGKNMVSAIASATISSAVNGGSFEDSVKAALISGFLDTAAASGANWIGDVTRDGKLSQTLAENFANKIMHGLLGCAIGAAKANSEAGCASGAIGGVVGHATADAVKGLGLKGSEVLALGQITSVLAATLAQKDLNIANSSAQNAILNNYLNHTEAKSLSKAKQDLANCKDIACQTKQQQIIQDLQNLSFERDEELKTTCRSNPTGDACRTLTQNAKAAFNTYGSDGIYSYDPIVAAEAKNARQAFQTPTTPALGSKSIFDKKSEGIINGLLVTGAGIVVSPVMLANLGTNAISGDEQAQQQLKDLVKDIAITVTNIPEAIGKKLDEADKAEANGDYALAAQIRTELVATAIGVVYSGLKLPKIGAGKITPSSNLGGTIDNPGIVWGKGIGAQGYPWEKTVTNGLSKNAIDLNEIKPNFKAFDNFDDGVAISAKTLDTNAPSYVKSPSSIYSTLKDYVNKMDKFVEDGAGTFKLTSADISRKEMQLAIPANTSTIAMKKIELVQAYAAKKGISIVVTKIK